MLSLIKFIPKTIKLNEKCCKYKLHSTVNKISGTNKRIEKGKIGIWYETRTPINGRVIHYQILPKFINEDKGLYESIGLYLAEGGLNPCYSFSFSNDEPRIINTLMRSLRRHLEIPFSNWSWSICFNHKLKKEEDEKTTKEREKASINFWLKKTEIKPKLASKTPCRYSNKNSEGELRTKKKWGSLTIVFGNKILKNLWLKIIDELIKKTIQNRDQKKTASLLRGWIAGDGYCRYEVYDKPRRELGIVCKDQEKVQILYKLFDILGIKPSTYKNCLSFTKADYLVKAYNYKLTSLHFLKHLNLLKSLLSYKRIPESIEKLDLKEIEKEFYKIERKIKNRERFFKKLKEKRAPKLKEEVNWQFLINGLLIKEGMTSKEFSKEIGCAEAYLIGKWLKKGVRPSRKYWIKILEKTKKYNKKELTKLGEFFSRGNWEYLLKGLQIFLKASRREIAEKIGVHPGTIESTINQRTKVNRDTAAKILNLIERYGKSPEEILQIYFKSRNINWPDLIKRILIENEWSQRELAEKIGCSRSLIREWLGDLEPTNQYKGKLLEMPKYNGKINFNFRTIINEVLKTHTLSDLKEELNISQETIRGWKKICRIQPRHIKKIIKLRDKIK